MLLLLHLGQKFFPRFARSILASKLAAYLKPTRYTRLATHFVRKLFASLKKEYTPPHTVVIYFYVVFITTHKQKKPNRNRTMQTEVETQEITPATNSTILGAGEDIRLVADLQQFHTPIEPDKANHNYHAHVNLTSHKKFAELVLEEAQKAGLKLSQLCMKVDKVKPYETQTPKEDFNRRFFSSLANTYKQPKKVANRFFLMARIDNEEYRLDNDVDTFIIARNSHDKSVPMQVAIGNKVIICSNLMFGGDISIKAKNTKFGLDNFHERFQELLSEYTSSLVDMRKDIKYFKHSFITPEEGLSFIAYNSDNDKFINTSRIHAVCRMFLEPEHREAYQDALGNERWSLWRLLNAYTYAHRGEPFIDPKTKEEHPTRRINATSIDKRKRYTKDLWQRLSDTRMNLNHESHQVLTKHHWQRD